MNITTTIIQNSKEFKIPKHVIFEDYFKIYNTQIGDKNEIDCKVVYITYFNEYGVKTKIQKYKYVDLSQEKISENLSQEINIDLKGCYIENITGFIKRIKENLNEKIKIKNMEAKDAFFHATKTENSGGIIQNEMFLTDIIFLEKANFNNCTFKENIIFKDIEFKCNANFRNVNFIDKVNFYDINFKHDLFLEEINVGGLFRFHNSIVEGTTDFTRSKFNYFTFFIDSKLNNVSFVNTNFNGKLIMKSENSSMIFRGEVSFKRAQFLKKCLFEDIQFNNKLIFKNTKCNEPIIFSKTSFQRAIFNHSNFKSNFDLIFSKFDKKANFENIKFYNKVRFTSTEFLDSAIFDNSIFYEHGYFYNTSYKDELSFKRCVFNDYIDLRLKSCRYVNLEESLNKGVLDFKPRKNESVYINNLNIYNLKNLGLIYIHWFNNNVKEIVDGEDNKYSNIKDQYRLLKENYNKLGEYEFEDQAYVNFKKESIRYKKNSLCTEIKKENELLKKSFHIFFEFRNKNKLSNLSNNLYRIIKLFLKYSKALIYFILNFIIQELIGEYGTSPKRIFSFMIFTVFGFSFKYLFFFSEFNCQTYKKSLYHSIITFLTIGYGSSSFSSVIENISDNFMLILLSGIEGFIGMFLMAYFTVAFVRKVLR
jgi:uncharacterized protein YjbI with pentapeptide repeats